MNRNPDPEREDPLLDAVLRDENWQTTSASFKAEALGTFRARQRQRRLLRCTGWAMVLAAVVVGAVHWFGHLAAPPRRLAVNQNGGPKESGNPRFLTDEELLASFPKGSCFLAEIDGQEELVFLDLGAERVFVADPSRRGN